jgi:tetratricopeptide (TPR) repeat protein
MPPTRTSVQFVLVLVLAALTVAGCSGSSGTGPPEDVIRLNILGTAYLGQQKWTEAGDAFTEALRLRPDDPVILTNRAVGLNQEGEIELAIEQLERALAADPDYPYAHYNLGLIENRRGNFPPAAEHFAAVARFDSRDLHTQYYLGSALSRIDREGEAIAAYRRALSIDPDHVSSLYGLGRTLLQRGDRDEGTRLIQRSQEVRARSGLDEAVGGQYGEQGPFALGIDYPADALRAGETLDLRFEPVAQAPLENSSGPVWTRIPGPNAETILLVGDGGSLRRLSGDNSTEPIGANVVVARAGDVDNDESVELVAVVAAAETLALTRFEIDGSAAVALGSLDVPVDSTVDLVLVDADHDGDLDLFLCWIGTEGAERGCVLGTNDGSGAFDLRDSSEHGFALDGRSAGEIDVAFSDLDNDRDIDLVAAGPERIHVFSNQRDGTFLDVSESLGLATTGGRLAAIADLNKDGLMDLVLAGSGIEILWNRRDGFESGARFDVPPQIAAAAVVLDYDNDGFLDLALSGDHGVTIARNTGDGWVPQAVAGTGLAAPLAALDHDGDGDADLATWSPGESAGSVALHSNEGHNPHHWIRLASRGVGDNRYGIGTKVDVLAGALRQKFEVFEPLPILVGLGPREQVQSARYVWPSGVLQDEIELPADELAVITQLDRKGTSCPLLYAWRDARWNFVTDFLGGAAVGYQHAPGVFSTPDTDEYVRIEGGLEPDEHGLLRLRLNNQLEEVLWFDRVELVVVDHPEGTQVYPNERLMPGPPFPEFAILASDDVRPIAAAREIERARDVTARLRESDREFADGFALLSPKGYAELHTLELDLGPFPEGSRVVLLLDGWIDYADSTSNLAAHQAGQRLIPPRLQLADGRGGWIAVDEPMGFPAGLPKTMVVNVGDRFPSADHRLRITTNMRIYWDRARVMVGGEDTPFHVSRISPVRAELRFGGFPRPIRPDGKNSLLYDPQIVAVDSGFKAHIGSYTSFGDVRELLETIDDRFVTTHSGDEIELRFPSPGAPEPGRTRTFLLFADGFGKDMDVNSAASNEVGPIPFHGMPTYPYGVGLLQPGPGPERGSASRYVAPRADGLPGARPQALASAADHVD